MLGLAEFIWMIMGKNLHFVFLTAQGLTAGRKAGRMKDADPGKQGKNEFKNQIPKARGGSTQQYSQHLAWGLGRA